MRSRLIRLLGLVVPGLVLLVLANAMRDPTPIHSDFSTDDLHDEINCDSQLHPWGSPQAPVYPAGPEDIRVEYDKVTRYVTVRSNTGALVSRALSPALRCGSGDWKLDVCQSAGGKGYYVVVKGECNSGCCDIGYLPIDHSGRRLDDGLRERLLWRLGWSGVILLTAVAAAGLCLLVGGERPIAAVVAGLRKLLKLIRPMTAWPGQRGSTG